MAEKNRYKVRLYDETDKDIKHASLEWLKQQLGLCDLKSEFKAFQRRVTALIQAEAERRLIEKLKECGEMDTRQLTRFAWQQQSCLETEAMLAVIERFKQYKLGFKSRGKGKTRLWFLKEAHK